MMTVDTNVLVYVHDDHVPAKQTTAITVVRELMRREAPLALQCVGEFQNTVPRKLGVTPWLAAQEARNLLMSFTTFKSTESACLAALDVAATSRRSYWDALLIASAAEAGCTVLFSEDRQDRPSIAGVEIVNPFDPHGFLSDRAKDLLDL